MGHAGDLQALTGFMLVGFFAQMINGSLGMSYGILSVTLLLALGVPPVLANSSVHVSKTFTSGVSGLSHWSFGNVDRRLFLGLLVGGVAGGIAGAQVIRWLPEGILRPLVAIYLLLTGLNILRQSLRGTGRVRSRVQIVPLGAAGGFLDAVGGGGWGPVVTSTLLATGQDPRRSIGSVSFAEAFVAASIAVSLIFSASPGSAPLVMDWRVVTGLMVGGVVASPLAAWLCGRLPVQKLMAAVGLLVVFLSVGIAFAGIRALLVGP